MRLPRQRYEGRHRAVPPQPLSTRMGFLGDVYPKIALAATSLVLTATVPSAAKSVDTDPPAPAEKTVATPEKARKPAVPSTDVLLPHRPQGRQVSFWPSGTQVANARTIIRVGRQLGLPPRAGVIAVATSLQESKLTNLGHLGARNDHDSQGLFQQRPSTGWGSIEQITNPAYSSTAFYRALKRVPRWQSLPLTQAAQKVQISAFPFAYAKWEIMASNLVLAYHGKGPYAGIAKAVERAIRDKAERSRKAAEDARDQAKDKVEDQIKDRVKDKDKVRDKAKDKIKDKAKDKDKIEDKAKDKVKQPRKRDNGGSRLPGWLGG